MQLTRAADYAVRVMMHMANAAPGEYAGRPVLAAANGVPDSFLSKILQALARAGLVVVRRGPEGGFALSPHGRQASLLDVVEAIDGPIALNLCLEAADGCENQSWCAAHIVWTEAQQAMLKVLGGAKIADLATQSVARRQGGVPPARSLPSPDVSLAPEPKQTRLSSDVLPAPQQRRSPESSTPANERTFAGGHESPLLAVRPAAEPGKRTGGNRRGPRVPVAPVSEVTITKQGSRSGRRKR